MTLTAHDTVVLYPSGETRNQATVLHVEPLADGRAAVLLDRTSCHPVDATWPDQGPDHATIVGSNGAAAEVRDCLVAATDGTVLELEPQVRPGEPGWAFVVAHVVDADAEMSDGDDVEVVVDATYRRALSIGHTACHLASLALNAALSARWTKRPRLDGLGNADFDKEAIETSRILEFGAIDRFRLNKSLRRKGFVIDGLAEELELVQNATNAFLQEWIATGTPVHIHHEGDGLTDRRYWVATLNGETVRIPCGGTHAASLADLGDTRVELTLDTADATPILQMTTRSTV
jgi:Predicted metal-dependent hydrolases related to alanyl-tRNA synthetase HxxxH domain